ncbi:hypothetical protein IAR50_006087 [Cryptococcus sp. DSM 104548]
MPSIAKRTHDTFSSVADSLFPSSRYPDPRVTHPSGKTEDEQVIKMYALVQASDLKETEYYYTEFAGGIEALSEMSFYTEPHIDPGIEIQAPQTNNEGEQSEIEDATSGGTSVAQPLVPTQHRPPGEMYHDPWPRFPLTVHARSVGANKKSMFPRSALSFDVFDMVSSRLPTAPDVEGDWRLQVKENVIIPGTLRSVFDDKEASYFDGLEGEGERWKLDRIEWTGTGSNVGKESVVGWADYIPDSDWVFKRI